MSHANPNGPKFWVYVDFKDEDSLFCTKVPLVLKFTIQFKNQHTHLLPMGHANPNGPKCWAFNIFLCFIRFLWRLISLWHYMAQNNYVHVDIS